MKLKSISPSRIKTYDSCLFKYYLNYVLFAKLKSNWGAVHGTLIHDLLEFYANGQDTAWLARMYRGYAGTLETLDRYHKPTIMETPLVWAKPKEYADIKPGCDGCPFADIPENKCRISLEPLDKLPGCPRMLFEKSIDMMEDVMERYKTDIWPKLMMDGDKIVGAEMPFNLPIPGIDTKMIGVMDLVIKHDEDTLEVIDYKSGKTTQTTEECMRDIQPRMYSLACRRLFVDDVLGLGYKFKNIVLTFDYFTNMPITVAFSKEEDDKTEQFVKNKVKEIEETDLITRIAGERGSFDWRCKYMCDIEVCEKNWKGNFKLSDDKNS